MSTSQVEGHGVFEESQPILQMYISPSTTRSSKAGQPHRSPIVPLIGSPGLRLYLSGRSPSFARSAGTRRNSPTVTASSARAHTSVDARAHTSADTAVVPPVRSRKRKLTSDIRDDFTPMFDEDGRLMQGQCIHCDTIFQTDKQYGSSQCHRHQLVCTEKAKMDELIGSMQPNDARIPAVKRFKVDKERACYKLIRMIVLHELPFRIVEYAGFRRFVASLNPAFKLMCKTMIKEDCMAEFQKQKLELLEVLKNLASRVSLTVDLWTSNQEQGYICVTCHFLDNKWKLHKRIIKFACVESPWASWSQHVGQQQRQQTAQNELDVYLKEHVVSPDANIDILEWWMNNSRKYPTLSQMARDVIAVPASTVASESAFSTGSRVISDYRSRLTSKTVNGLICLLDWMRPSEWKETRLKRSLDDHPFRLTLKLQGD